MMLFVYLFISKDVSYLLERSATDFGFANPLLADPLLREIDFSVRSILLTFHFVENPTKPTVTVFGID